MFIVDELQDFTVKIDRNVKERVRVEEDRIMRMLQIEEMGRGFRSDKKTNLDKKKKVVLFRKGDLDKVVKSRNRNMKSVGSGELLFPSLEKFFKSGRFGETVKRDRNDMKSYKMPLK